jgi:aminopeptidase N
MQDNERQFYNFFNYPFFMNRLLIIVGSLLLLQWSCVAQDTAGLRFTRQDTLRGSVTEERAWWDVTHYALTVEPDFETKTIKGANVIQFNVVGEGQKMQIDMQEPMQIDRVIFQKKQLKYSRDGNVYYILFERALQKGASDSLKIEFSGKPREAINPPWDGGWIWKKDRHGNPWMTVACQGLGASVWYPCKDYQGDEPDKGALLTIIVPDTLVGVANGRLMNRESAKGKEQRAKGKGQRAKGKMVYTWSVSNPINSYNIVPYIGKYVNWSETFNGEKGDLRVSYWALEEDEQKARAQFQQVPLMLKCFEHWFGPYPFYEDGYKIVEAAHLGMEHQSAIAYGNQFKNGYLGKDLSETGWGLKWDFIIVHESGHEWFGNNITTKDIADMWVHEGFTNYSEVLFTTCQYGVQAGNEYCMGLRKNIENDQPLIGPYGVNHEGSVDMYYKGANLVHMIRQIINDDEKFRSLLRGLNKDFYHQTVTSKQIEDYISKKTGRDLSKLFEQYLHTIKIPVFQYQYGGGLLSYRWRNCVPGFDMPLKINAGKTIWLYPNTSWKTIPLDNGDITIDPNFYIDSKKM